METSPSRPGAFVQPSDRRRVVAFGGAILFAAGVAAGLAGATFQVALALELAVGLAAGGVATALYGLGTTEVYPWSRVSQAGLALAWTAIAGAALVPSGVPSPVPGGAWVLAYALGLGLVVLVETAVGPMRAPEESVPDPPATSEGPADETDSPKVVITKGGDGGWTWELRTPGGRVLASAPRTYAAATAAHRAATRAAEWVEGEPRIHTDATDPGRQDSASETRSLPSSEDPALPDGDADSQDHEEASEPGSTPAFVGAPANDASVFELDETESGWRWRLRFEDDAILAESPRVLPGLDATRRAVDRVRTLAPGAGALTYDPGAFEVYREAPDDDQWAWRLRSDDGEVIATGTVPVGSRGEGFGAVAGVKDAVASTDPQVRAVDGHHRWTLESDDEVVAQSPHGFETPDAAREAFTRVAEVVPDAGVLELDPAGFEVAPRPGGTWGWRLRHRDGRVLARSPPQATRDRSIEGLRTLKQVVPDADVSIGERRTSRIIEEALSDAAQARSLAENLRTPEEEDDEEEKEDDDGDDPTEQDSEEDDESEPGDPETVVALVEDEGWQWELRHGEAVLAVGEPIPDRSVAADAGARVATAVENATVVEVDPLAVEVYQEDGWRWRLVDQEGTTVARSPEAADRFQTARQNAEDALPDLSGDPEVYRGEGWRWRVRREGSLVAESGQGFGSPEEAREAFEALSADAETPIVECEAAVEVAPTGDGWGFRIRTVDGRELGESAETYPSAQAAVEVARRAVSGTVVSDDGNGADARGETGE